MRIVRRIVAVALFFSVAVWLGQVTSAAETTKPADLAVLKVIPEDALAVVIIPHLDEADTKISSWAAKVDDAWMAEDLVWFSGAAGREMRAPKGFLISHFFNHQTHHRGQVHAMLTAAGQETGDTDLFLIVPEPL